MRASECQADAGEKERCVMYSITKMISLSTRRSAKAAGLLDVLFPLRRKRVAAAFDPAAIIFAAQAAPAIQILLACLPLGTAAQRPRLQPDISGRRYPQRYMSQVYSNRCGALTEHMISE